MRNKILKFRAWDGLNKKFSYWTMNDLCTYAEKEEKPSALDDWQQDTGLLDRLGKEIYEGDICQWKAKDGTVVIDKIYWIPAECRYAIGVYMLTEAGALNVQIIGNIYESNTLQELQQSEVEISTSTRIKT